MQFLKELCLSNPQLLFIYFLVGRCFQSQLLISFYYYHLDSFSVFFKGNFTNKIKGKQATFAISGYERRSQISNMPLCTVCKSGVQESRFNLAGFSVPSRPRESNSEYSRKSVHTGTRDQHDNAFEVVQVESSVKCPGCPSGTGLLSTTNFKASGSSQRGKCV